MFKKHILVIGHPRSGTHFLRNTIGINMGLFHNRWSFIKEKHDVNHAFSRTIPSMVYYTHLPAEYFKHRIFDLIEDVDIFYIVRDGRDVICSIYDTHKLPRYKWIEEGKTLSQFIRGSYLKKSYIYKHTSALTPPEIWADHFNKWKGMISKEEFHLIYYEKLNESFDMVCRDSIFNYLNPDLQLFKRPAINSNTVCPRKAQSGEYKQRLSLEDLQFFNKQTDNLITSLYNE